MVVSILKGGKYLPRYFNLPHSKVGNVNMNRMTMCFVLLTFLYNLFLLRCQLLLHEPISAVTLYR